MLRQVCNLQPFIEPTFPQNLCGHSLGKTGLLIVVMPLLLLINEGYEGINLKLNRIFVTIPNPILFRVCIEPSSVDEIIC